MLVEDTEQPGGERFPGAQGQYLSQSGVLEKLRSAIQWITDR